MDRVASGKYDFNSGEWSGVSEEAKKFIRRMMEYDPNARYSAEQALSDPWLKLMLGETTIDKPIAISALTNLKHFRVTKKKMLFVLMFIRLIESFKRQHGFSL